MRWFARLDPSLDHQPRYAGEIAVIEKLVSGVIPQAVVRTEAGKTRQVRTIDLEPVGAAEARPVEVRPVEAHDRVPGGTPVGLAPHAGTRSWARS